MPLVLGVRAAFPEGSLADLYDPLNMPTKLVKAHQALDKAIDLCYRPQAFTNENTVWSMCLICILCIPRHC